MKKKLKLGEILIEKGFITAKQLDNALYQQKGKNKKIGKVLIEMGYINEVQVAEALTDQLSLKIVDCSHYNPSNELLSLVPKETAEQKLVLPLERKHGTLSIAMANPLDWETIEDISFKTGLMMNVAIASESNIISAIEQFYSSSKDSFDILKELPTYDNVEFVKDELDENEQNVTTQSLFKISEAPPIVRLVTAVIAGAVSEGASDIHFEPKKRVVQIRYRIDGALKKVQSYPKHIQDAVISRIKIISNLDITNRRLPQDGRGALRLENKSVDLRISTLPSAHGEKVVIRLLDASTGLVPLDKLGISGHVLSPLMEISRQPQGMLLVTGPTGSGKTTTLYSILQLLRNETKNIITLEDPIEYELEDITQVMVNENIGYTFANALRSVLRQDPDIVMLGEIRDVDTAEIATKAALTGHFVLSTLHTNDTVATVTRLIDIGLEPFLVTSAVSGILAQRLIRNICPDCKAETTPPEQPITYNVPPVGTYYKGAGCSRCNNTGYKGRVGVYELLRMNTKLKRLISKHATEDELWQCALQSGTKTMFEDAWLKVAAGLTTVEEVLAKVPSPHTIYPERNGNDIGTNNKVLLFNSDEAEAGIIRSALEADGHEVIHSSNGSMLEFAKREHPCLIIIDGSQDRLDCLKEIRNNSHLAYTPIICLADPDNKKHESEGFRMGINDFIYKPINSQNLIFSINRILNSTSATRK